MRRIKEVLRLSFDGNMNQSQVARALGLARSTVQDYLRRFDQQSATWETANRLSDEELDALLFPKETGTPHRTMPDFDYIHKELKRPGVTLQLLWEEYIAGQPAGYRYSQFCKHYRQWQKKLKTWMRQPHIGGERVFADYSGKKPFIIISHTGEVKYQELFVMSWGASHYLYAEAQPSQELTHWVMGHVRAFEYFGCVPKLVVPDNLKAAVSKACIYDPDVNRSYTELADHYKFGVLPARPGKPKDKAKVETGVQIVQRWILARLRNRVYHSVAELNQAIWDLLEEANSRPMQRLGQSRKDLFLEVDKPHATPLPASRYIFSRWLTVSCGFDYHVQVEKHYYSVPYHYYGKQFDIRFNERVVEIFVNRQRIALHQRNLREYGYTTVAEHLPPKQRSYLQWTPARLINWGCKIGFHTGQLVKTILESKRYPEQGFRPARAVLQLGQSFGNDRLEKAAKIAMQHNRIRVREIREILKKAMDRQHGELDQGTVQNLANVRGADYFREKAGEK